MALSNQELIQAIRGGSSDMGAAEEQALDFVLNAGGDFQNTLDVEAQKKRDEDAAKIKAKEEAEKKEAAKALRQSLSSEQFLFTDVTGGRLPKSGIDHVMFRYPEETWDKEHHCNIPEVDPFFYWDTEVLEALWLSYVMDENCLLVGGPGTGKSTASRQLAAWIAQPFARFNGKDGIEPASFLGYVWATTEGTEWKDGLMPQAVAEGYYTCIDEVMKLPPGIQMALQSLYEKDGFLMLDEKPGTIQEKHIHPRKEFRIVCTDNTNGTGDGLDKYAASMMQDTSTLDRFGLTQEVGYLRRDVEIEMIQKRFPAVEQVHIKRSVVMANTVREAYDQGNLSITLSPRGLMVIAGLIERGLSLEASIELAFIKKLGDDSERKVAKGFLNDAI